MSSKLTKVLNISLEDYIAKKAIVTTPAAPEPEDSSSEADYFKRPIRSEMETDDDQDAIQIVEDCSVEIENIKNEIDPAKLESELEGPVSGTEEKKGSTINLRTTKDNPISKNSTGVSPLTSVKAVFERHTEQLISSLNENASFRNVDSKNRIFNNLKNGQFQRPKNNFGLLNGNDRNSTHRHQYGKDPNMMASFNPSFHRVSQRSNVSVSKDRSSNLRQVIPVSSSSLQSHGSNASSRPLPTQFATPQLVTFANMLNQINQTANNQNRQMFANVMRNVMHQQVPGAAMVAAPMMMNSPELMPLAAQTLLNHITTVQQNFGPKYDMKLQEEIHALQKKSALYQSNGVVSTDGPGIDGKHFNPVTTDVSMNMRFS